MSYHDDDELMEEKSFRALDEEEGYEGEPLEDLDEDLDFGGGDDLDKN